MQLRTVLIALAACALIARVAVPASAAATPPLLPLEIGNHWEYLSASGTVYAEAITGTRVVLGRTVTVKSYLAGPDAGLQNWWLTGPNGEVLLAGADRPDAGVLWAYEPPITYCGGSPALGASWLTHVVAYDLLTSGVFAEFDITFVVIEDVTLTVPAGTFPSFGVGQIVAGNVAPLASSRGFTLDGRLASSALKATASTASDWFSPGVGVVQLFTNSELFRLTGYGNPTPARTTSWGMLKQLYR